MKKLLWPSLCAVVVVALDQITKSLALKYLQHGQPVDVLGSFFRLTLVYNEGGAMGTNFASSTYYLIASICILLFVLYYIYTNRDIPRIAYPLALIAGGAIGNIVDRLMHGVVVDFLDVDFFNISIGGFHLDRWWTFNIADAAISCSIVFLLLVVFFFKPETGTTFPDDSDTPAEHSQPAM